MGKNSIRVAIVTLRVYWDNYAFTTVIVAFACLCFPCQCLDRVSCELQHTPLDIVPALLQNRDSGDYCVSGVVIHHGDVLWTLFFNIQRPKRDLKGC